MIGLPTLRSAQQLRSRLKSWRAFGETVALIPIEGRPTGAHAAALGAAQAEADRVLAALLPAAGAPGDAADAPNTHEAAAVRLLDEAGADALYLPSSTMFRPAGPATVVHVPGLADVLEGEETPAALDVFAADMVRLLAQCQPDAVVFTERDWQRRLIAGRVARDFDLCGRVLSAPEERDDDGAPLDAAASEAARAAAARLWRTLSRAAADIGGGADADATLDAAADALADEGAEVEHLDLRDAETLAELERHDPARPARLFAAIEVDGVRLSDTVPV